MFNKLKKSTLFKNTFIYTFLQLINKGIPFFLLPILTHYLSSNDYGMIASYNTFLGAMAIFVGLSVSGAVNVNFFKMTSEELKRYNGNVFNILIVSSFAVFIVVYVAQDFIGTFIEIPPIWMYLAIIVAFMQTITGINLTIWRSEHKAAPFAFYEIAITVFNVAVSLWFVVALNYGWEGRVSGTALAAVVFGGLSIYILYKRGYVSIDHNPVFVKDALKFGVPLLPHQLALWMRSGVDIILITSIVGVADTGIYSVGYQFASVISIFVFAFHNAYSPYLYEKLNHITYGGKVKIVKFTYMYFIAIILFALAASGIFSLILPYIVGEAFHDASLYIPYLSLAFAFQGMYLMVGLYIFYVNKTHLLSVVTVSTSVLHVSLSYLLIDGFGAIGAAYASVISFFVSFLLVWRLSTKVYELPWFSGDVFRFKGEYGDE